MDTVMALGDVRGSSKQRSGTAFGGSIDVSSTPKFVAPRCCFYAICIQGAGMNHRLFGVLERTPPISAARRSS
ncbi:MAG: hypothetical protein H0W46_02390 [Acidimicrobiia bacterium]|nr:hypothetical protein [Acidimicrobiia bacterium]